MRSVLQIQTAQTSTTFNPLSLGIAPNRFLLWVLILKYIFQEALTFWMIYGLVILQILVILQGLKMSTEQALRIEVDVTNTEILLGTILQNFRAGNLRVSFLTPPSQGPATLARIRSALSRVRKRNTAKGRLNEKFLIQSCVYPYTNLEGKRHDCVIVWKKKTDRHLMSERFEDVLGHRI